jgi:hypothetical protein
MGCTVISLNLCELGIDIIHIDDAKVHQNAILLLIIFYLINDTSYMQWWWILLLCIKLYYKHVWAASLDQTAWNSGSDYKCIEILTLYALQMLICMVVISFADGVKLKMNSWSALTLFGFQVKTMIKFVFALLNVVILVSGQCVTRYDHCSGVYHCLSEVHNTSSSYINPSCPITIPKSLVPPPDPCIPTPDGCVFFNPCIAWNYTCSPVSYNCTLKTVYHKYLKNHTGCYPMIQPLPLPTQQCVWHSSDGTCNWYNGCTMWWNGCTDVGYHCGTLVDQYKLNHTFPNCPTNPVGLPAGECIYQNGSCIWSTCHPWLGYCESYWLCGSEYDLQLYLNLPYPPCPPPPTNHTPPPEPGVCRYNLTSNRFIY